MTPPQTNDIDRQEPRPSWIERDVSGHGAMLTGILAQVSIEALQGETLEAILQRIVDCLTQRLPVAIASIILLNDEGTHFVQEVWAGRLELDLPSALPWPVTTGAAGRCARSGEAQLIADVQDDPDYVPGNREVSSEYLVPIRHRTRLHGVLNLESTRADFFTAEVRAVFDAVATQIAGAVHLARVMRALEEANRKLEQLSMSDGLTGIANRRCFDLRLAMEWQRHARDRSSLALLLIDVDSFKRFNDAFGHLHGDECLRELAHLCAESANGLGAQALVARYGGEEFAMLLAHTDLRAARQLAGRVRRRIQALVLMRPGSQDATHVTVSIGAAAVIPDAAQLPEILIETSDRALYSAKARGRNRVATRAVPVGNARRGTG